MVTPSTNGERGGQRRHIVLLGASNLTIGLPTVLQTALRHCGGPLGLWIAAGHGRSYGKPSTVFGRTLPGILESELWQSLDRESIRPAAALVTDIGNDLLFDAPVEQIVAWVEACLDRLQRSTPRIILTALPIANLEHLTPHKFYLLRSLLFPNCRLSFETVIERAYQLDDAVRALARQRGMQLEQPRAEWYGFDPIHIRYRHLDSAWTTLLSAWRDGETEPPMHCRWRDRVRIARLKPALRWVRGIERRVMQPALVLRDGSSLALY
jgi:hypothetical protein